jgi:hypothetical protein
MGQKAAAFIAWVLSPVIALFNLFGTLYEQYKFARRFTLHWSQGLITYNVLMFWRHLEALKDPHMIFLGGITALLGVSIGLYQWDAAREQGGAT